MEQSVLVLKVLLLEVLLLILLMEPLLLLLVGVGLVRLVPNHMFVDPMVELSLHRRALVERVACTMHHDAIKLP